MRGCYGSPSPFGWQCMQMSEVRGSNSFADSMRVADFTTTAVRLNQAKRQSLRNLSVVLMETGGVQLGYFSCAPKAVLTLKVLEANHPSLRPLARVRCLGHRVARDFAVGVGILGAPRWGDRRSRRRELLFSRLPSFPTHDRRGNLSLGCPKLILLQANPDKHESDAASGSGVG